MKIKKVDLERLLYVEALILVNRELRRSDLTNRFGISNKTATLLIKMYEESCPGQLYLNMGLQRPMYEPSKTCKHCLFSSLNDAKKYLEYSNLLNTIVSRSE